MESQNLVEKITSHKTMLGALIAAMLSVVTFIVYYPSLRYGFLFDDLPTITEYFYIRVFDPVGQFFSNSRWISRVLNQWTYKHWKADPFGYRIIDLMMHIGIGLMIFFILVKVFSMARKESLLSKYAYWFSTIVAGLFLLHPTQTQTATYITQMRLEGLVVFFVFAVLISFTQAVYAVNKNTRMVLYSLTTILMMFAAGTKEIIIVLPFLLFIFDWFLLAEGEWSIFKQRLPIHGVLLVTMMGTLSFLGYTPTPKLITAMAKTELRNNRGNTLTATATEKIKPFPFFISQFKVVVHYISIFFNPFKLSFDYDVKLAKGVFTKDVIFPLFFLLMLFGMCCYLFYHQKNHPVVFGLVWFFIAMLPRASIFPATELICDYKTFLPSFGILFVLGIGILHFFVWSWKFISWKQKKETQAAMVGMLFFALGAATVSRNVVWTSELTFWKDVIAKAPLKSRGYNNYAVALWEAGYADDSIANYKKALDLDGSYGEPHVNLATIYQGMGRKEEALEHYKKALDTGEIHSQLYHNLAILHLSNGHTDLAVNCFKEAVATRPYFTQSWIQLGKLYQSQKKWHEALAAYDQGLKGDRGNDRELIYLYASVNYQLGNIDRALESFSKIDKHYSDVAFQLGCCHYAKHHYADASNYFATACSREPKNIMYQYNYGMSLLNACKYREALEVYQKCHHERDSLPFLVLHEANCLLQMGNKEVAKKELLALIKTTQHAPVKEDAQKFMKENGLA